MVADTFERELLRRSVSVTKCGLTAGNYPSVEDEDCLILLFAVHAFNAPEIVYDWIETISDGNQVPVAVISVSAGGERTPNMACRLSTINRLEKKNCQVFYEKMMVMPSNWVMKTKDGLTIRLLNILPSKVEHIVDDIFSGVEHRTSPPLIDRILSRIGELEKRGAKRFGKKILVNDDCNGCGWCERNCPSHNISMAEGKPLFDGKCLLCLKCLYGCPNRALEPGKFRFFVIKEGYDLKSLEKRMQGVEPAPVADLAKGYLLKGVKDYLLED